MRKFKEIVSKLFLKENTYTKDREIVISGVRNMNSEKLICSYLYGLLYYINNQSEIGELSIATLNSLFWKSVLDFKVEKIDGEIGEFKEMVCTMIINKFNNKEILISKKIFEYYIEQLTLHNLI